MDDLMHLSKGERRRLKRQRKKERREKERTEKKRNKTKNMLKILIPVIIVIGVAGFFLSSSFAETPRIQVMPGYHDFGDVPAGGSVVSALMDVTNVGKGDLIMSNMDSSCGCTSASMIVDGKEGPRFSMSAHGTNPIDWSVTLKPGQTAKLKVYYDPSVHSDQRGPVTRYITIFSNDLLNSQMKVTIEANQV